MCGISGLMALDGAALDLGALRWMNDRQRHRGPDDEGYLLVNSRDARTVLCGGPETAPELGLPLLEQFSGDLFDFALAFRRLSILDLSPAGHQPMSTRDERYWIIFNGEVYNYLELRAELAGYGHTFRSGSDTEVILAAYAEWGPECLGRFNGMWGLAIWDNQDRALFLARDRFGVKPVYYTRTSDRFAFASEIKALVGAQGIPFVPNDEAIYRYLVGGLLPSPQQGETFFHGVRALPPGCWLRVKAHEPPALQGYYRLPDDIRPAETAEASVAGYRERFVDSIRLRLRADVPIGTCLSGGVDSSSIVGVVNRLMAEGGLTAEQIGKQQRTFSAVYGSAAPYNERAHVDKVLAATGAQGNFTYPTAERLRADLEKLVWHQDEPFLSTSIFAQWCVMAKARERSVTVLLDGQGADEALGGYRPFEMFLADLLRAGRLGCAAAEARAIQQNAGRRAAGLLLRSAARTLPLAWLNLARQTRAKASSQLDWLNPDFARAQGYQTGADWKNWNAHTNLDRHLRELVLEDSLPHLLRYEDRNSMAYGIEARVPFLDYRVVEYSFGEAAPWRIHAGWTKWPLRRAMQGLAPEPVLWRRDKVGFETPEADWLKTWLLTQPDFFYPAETRAYLSASLGPSQLAQALEASQTAGRVWRGMNLGVWLHVWKAA